MNRASAQRTTVFLLVCAFIGSVYLLTYRATIQSGDTRRALDAVTSFVRYGDWLMDESSWTKPSRRVRADATLPLSEYDVEERLSIILAAPLLSLAEAVPRLGNIHTVWLFNIIVTSLSVGTLYLVARQLGFADAPAVVTALTAGISTNMWAYSQTFFREPLAMLFVLLAWHFTLIARQKTLPRQLAGFLLAGFCLALAYLVKHSALLALPGLIALALPDMRAWNPGLRSRIGAATMATIAGLLLLLMLVDPLPSIVQDVFSRFDINSAYAGEALRAYLLSPAASIWATSPILLLSLGGCLSLWRDGRRRLVIAIALTVSVYALGHALATGAHWFGGLSYPPRFLLPTIPVLALAMAPLAEKALHSRRWRTRALWISLLLYGVWIQFSAVSLDWRHYSDSLPPSAQRNAEWAPALIEPQYYRWVVLPQRWSDLGLGFLWTRSGETFWGVSYAVYAAALALMLWITLRRPKTRWRYAVPPLVFLCLPLTLINLSLVYDKDPRTRSGQQALHDALAFLERNARENDLLLVASNDYGDFIFNHVDTATPRAVVLPRPLAQAASEKQPARVVSHNPNDWFDVPSARIIRHLAAKHDRIWLLADTSRYQAWSFMPLERYLAQHYFPLREVALGAGDETVRLYEVSTASGAPNPLSPYSGDIVTDLRYGEHIDLVGLAMPRYTNLRPGDAVELSLLWRTDAWLERNYTIASFIVDATSQQPVAQGQDTAPQFGFAPTSSWAPGREIWDNRAMRLPPDTPTGEYRVWVVVYSFAAESGEIERLPVRGGRTAEAGTVGVLPLTLSVS